MLGHEGLAIQSQTIYTFRCNPIPGRASVHGGASSILYIRKGGVKVPKISLNNKLLAKVRLKLHVSLPCALLLIYSK